jgi:tryptophan synthase beta chain
VRFVAVTDEEAVSAFRETCRLEGIIPALECSHAIAWLMAEGAGVGSGYDLLTLSGRGDKDLAEVLGLDE